MVQRIALLTACLAASATLAVALALAGFGPASRGAPADMVSANAAAIESAASPAIEASPTPVEQVQVNTIYVKPTASPKVIKVIRMAPPKPPIVVRKVVITPRADGENDGGD